MCRLFRHFFVFTYLWNSINVILHRSKNSFLLGIFRFVRWVRLSMGHRCFIDMSILAYISASNWDFADEHKSWKRKAMVLTSSISLANDSIFLRNKLSKLFPMDPYLPPWHVEPSSTCPKNSFLFGIFRFFRRVRLSMESGVTWLQKKNPIIRDSKGDGEVVDIIRKKVISSSLEFNKASIGWNGFWNGKASRDRNNGRS